MLKVEANHQSWPLQNPFTISRGTKTTAEVVVVEIGQNGVTGRGECVPYARYGETIESVLTQIKNIDKQIEFSVESIQTTLKAGAARNALDCALWDLRAKQTGERAWDLAELSPPTRCVSAYTLGLDSTAAMAKSAADNSHRPLLKLKLDNQRVVERVTAVHNAAPDSRLIIDANEAWDLALLQKVCPQLAELAVEMIEQPLPADKDDELSQFNSPIPLCADESCHTTADLTDLKSRYQMVNIKLDKTGGLTEALKLRARAIEYNLQFMVGCMIGTSLAMAPARLLCNGASFVDLDGPLLLAKDRGAALRFEHSQIDIPQVALWG